MGNVVEMHKPPQDGDTTFVMCGCTDEGTPMIPLAIMGDSPFIAALVCPECEGEVPVVNGYMSA